MEGKNMAQQDLLGSAIQARTESRAQFRAELERLINKFSVEFESNTPDFILADYMMSCLCAFEATANARAKWYAPEADQADGPNPPSIG